MKEYYATIKLPYKEIEVISRLLRSAKVHPKADPPPQPADVNTVVEIPLTVKVQGKDNLGIAEEIIIGNKKNPRAEIITGFSELSSSPLSELIKFLLDRGWETIAILIGGIAATYGTFFTLSYHYADAKMSLDLLKHLELIALGSVPAFLDLCYAASWRKKNSFALEQNNELQESKPKTNNPPTKCPMGNHL